MKKEAIERICVFCGSNSGIKDIYQKAARTLAGALAEREIDLVYGGGSIGLMGIIADEMLRLKREVIGIIPHGIAAREIAHQGLTDLRIVRSMHERKSLMAELSDGFIALPGGFGTFEELLEIITWAQLGIHQKPIGILNVAGYYDILGEMVERGIEEGFIRPQYRHLLGIFSEVEGLLDWMKRYEPLEGVTKWIDLVKS